MQYIYIFTQTKLNYSNVSKNSVSSSVCMCESMSRLLLNVIANWLSASNQFIPRHLFTAASLCILCILSSLVGNKHISFSIFIDLLFICLFLTCDCRQYCLRENRLKYTLTPMWYIDMLVWTKHSLDNHLRCYDDAYLSCVCLAVAVRAYDHSHTMYYGIA